MNRLQELFKNKNKNILSVYFTAGYPELNATGSIIKSLQRSGADFIEAGMPFSDPMADGPTIQHSSDIALKNGMNLDIYFHQLKEIRDETSVPLLAMGYVNQMMRYGEERFLQRCQEAGIAGLILPDLPLKIYLENYKTLFEKYGLVNIFLITPQTSEERIRQIDDVSNAFIYMVSSASTTGSKKNINKSQLDYFKKIKAMNLKNPLIIGFGISNRETFETACYYAAGAIVGSAFIKAIEQDCSEENIESFVRSIRG
jgi:tryptophan synthase alpha chain